MEPLESLSSPFVTRRLAANATMNDSPCVSTLTTTRRPRWPRRSSRRSCARRRDMFGNASSVHHFGQQAKAALDDARSAVAALIGGDPSEVVFTSGGTESDNFAIRGAAEALEPTGRRHLIASAIEHEAVLNTLKALGAPRLADDAAAGRRSRASSSPDRAARGAHRRHGARLGDAREQRDRHDSADRRARRDRARARRAVAHRRRAVGRQDSGRRARARRRSAVAVGAQVQRTEGRRRALDQARHADAADPHRRQARAQPPRRHRERAGDRRHWASPRGSRAARWRPRRRASARCAIGSRTGILAAVPGTVVNGARGSRVPNTTNISFDRVEAESLLIALDLEGIAVSTGSACSSGTLEPSHVLRAMGLPTHRTQNSLRFSLGTVFDRGGSRSRGRGAAAAGREAARADATGSGVRTRGSDTRLTKPEPESRTRLMRIVVAMSGGVDSSVAAALLAEQGHDVIGLSMQLYDQTEGQTVVRQLLLARRSPRRAPRRRGDRHPALHPELRAAVRRAGRRRTSSASTPPGRTPLPCAHCNSDLKFATLAERARGFGADAVATGHYARVERDAATRAATC